MRNLLKTTLAASLVAVFLGLAAWAQNVGIYRDQGGNTMHIGSGADLQVESGGTIDYETGSNFKLAGTAMTATAAELNKLAGVTGGTVTVSKGLVVDANKRLDTLVLGTLKLGASAGTTVNSTAGELNEVDGMIASASFTAAAEASNERVLSVQLKDADNASISGRRFVTLYLSSLSNGSAITGTAPNSTASVNASGSIIFTDLTRGGFRITTDANGAFDLKFGETGVASWSPVLVLPTGKIQVGPDLNFS